MSVKRPQSQYSSGNDNTDEGADGLLPLHDAVSKRDIVKVRSWIESGGDLRSEAFKQDRLGRTALHLLPFSADDAWRFTSHLLMNYNTDNTFALARLLIAAMGPDALDISDCGGRTVLHRAAEAGDSSMLTLFATELEMQTAAREEAGAEREETNSSRAITVTSGEAGAKKQGNRGRVSCGANAKEMWNGRTPLHLAALALCSEAARILIDYFGADVSAKDDYGRTPLHVLLAERAQDHTQVLFGHRLGGDSNRERERYVALVGTAHLLLDRMGDKINEKDMFGKTPLHLAAEAVGTASDFVKTVFLCKASLPVAPNITAKDTLCYAGSDTCNRGLLTDVKDAKGRTPLYYSVIHRCYGTARALVEDLGADVSIRDLSGNTLLHALAHSALGEGNQSIEEKEGRAALARVFISKMDKDVVNAVDEFGNTATNIAARVGAFDFIVEMLSCSRLISPNARDSLGRTVLHYAALKQKTEVARLLIEDFGADAWVQDHEGRTALHFLVPQYLCASYERDNQLRAISSIARLMIETAKENVMETNGGVAAAKAHAGWKVGPYTQDKHGDTALHRVAHAGAYHFTKVLFELAPAHCLNCRGAMGRSPLHCAASSGDINLVKLLVDEYGADVAATDDNGNTPLHLSKLVSVPRFLIEAGADVTTRNKGHQTPIHTACERISGDSTERLQVFLGLNVDVNVKDAKGRTPLHYCAIAGPLSSVAMLLNGEKGVLVDVNAVDDEGMTALDHALSAGKNNTMSIANLLMKHGGVKGAEPLLPQ